jgi:methionyl-tRNA formyltransferase
VDLYLSGLKGASAARVAIEFKHLVDSVILAEDDGELGDSYMSTFNLLESHGIKVLSQHTAPIHGEICLAVGWKRLIKSSYTSIFVIHDSLLPRYRGWNPLVTALQNGDRRLGATLILADDEMDHGPIIKFHDFEIHSPARISHALQLVGTSIEFLTEYLFQNLDSAALSAVPQDHNRATISLWRNDEDYNINWNLSAEQLQRFIYSVSHPYKGARTFIDSRRIVVVNAEIISWVVPVENPIAGKVIAIEDSGPVIVCGEGFLQLTECRIDHIDGEIFKLRKIKTKLS